MKFAPNMLLALVGLRLSRCTPRRLLGLAFALGMGFGFALWKNRSCLLGFPPVGGGVGLAGAARRFFLFPASDVGQSGFASGLGLFSPSHDGSINDVHELLAGTFGIIIGEVLVVQPQLKLHAWGVLDLAVQ